MALKINIALKLPDASHPDRHFSFQLRPGVIVAPSCVYGTPEKIFVVSGIKESFRSFHKLLIKHRIIDRRFRWIYNEGHLVVLGNSFDDQEMHTEYLWFLYDLEQKAKRRGGCVHFIPGSHELVHINGKWRHEHPPYATASSSLKKPITALYNANLELRHWLGARNIVEKIGPLLFINKDTISILHQLHTISDVNHFARSVCANIPETLPNSIYTSSIVSEHIFLHYSSREMSITQEEVNAILKKFQANTLIIGEAMPGHPIALYAGNLIKALTNDPKTKPIGLLIRRKAFLRVDRQGHKEKINL